MAKNPRPLHFRKARDVFSYLRVHQDLGPREFSGVMAKLMSGFAPNVIADAMAESMDDLAGAYGTQMLMLIDQLHEPPLIQALRDWLVSRSDLTVEQRLPIIMVLHRAGEDTADLIGPEEADAIAAHQESAVQDMLDTLLSDPSTMPSFLENLSSASPERRAELVEEFGEFVRHPAMVDVARYLAMSHDPVFAAGALQLLGQVDSETARSAIGQVAAFHSRPVLRMRARQMAAISGEAPAVSELVDGHVTMIDGRGSGGIVLVARQKKKYVAAWFLCNAELGVKDLVGHTELTARDRDTIVKETLALAQGLDVLSGAPELAGCLLADALTRCGPHTSLELPYWLDQTIGLNLLPTPFEPTLEEWNLREVASEEYRKGVWELLSRVGCWFEESDLVYDRAEELLRQGIAPERLPPSHAAQQDIVEQIIRPRLDQYRRMILWMAGLWREQTRRDAANPDDEQEELFDVRVAMTIAKDLEDPTSLRNDHPFLAGLAELSLFKATRCLATGIDLRNPEVRRATEMGEDLLL